MIGALACLPPWSSATADNKPGIDVSKYPPEYKDSYKLFQVKCSKCHALARAIDARIKGPEWKGYIKKMIRRPGSGINEEAGERIYQFLHYYSTRPAEGEATPAAPPAVQPASSPAAAPADAGMP